MATVYDKSSLFLAPSGVSNGTVFVQKPVPIYGSEQVTNGDFSQTGAEEVRNGDFSDGTYWSTPTGWSINNGTLQGTNVNAISATQSGFSFLNKSFRVEYTITEISQGDIKVYLGGSQSTPQRSAVGTYVEYIDITSANATLYIQGINNFTGKIDNVSVKELGQDWTLGTGWSIGEDKAISDGSASNLDQSGTFLSGKTYKVVYDVLDHVSGDIRFRFTGTSNENGTLRNANGTYTEYIKLTNTQSVLRFPSSSFNGSIANISVQEVLSPVGDFTFTRGSNLSATRVNEAQLIEKGRENVLLQSNQFDTSWVQSDVTITSGFEGYDGTNNAWELTRTAAAYARMNQAATQSGVYAHSIYAKAGTLNWISIGPSGGGEGTWFNLSNGTIGIEGSLIKHSSIESVGNGWYRISVVVNNPGQQWFRLYPSDFDGGDESATATGTIYIQDAQLEQGLAATSVITTGAVPAQAGLLENTPRLDYSGGATCPSLLLEPSRTNLINQSEYFGSWGNAAASIVSNYSTSPEGSKNAYLLYPASDGSYRDKTLQVTGASGYYTFSCFIKSSGKRWAYFRNYFASNIAVHFDLQNGVVGTEQSGYTGKIESYGNGWYRCSMSSNFTGSNPWGVVGVSDADNSPAVLVNGTDGILVYGAQMEAASYPTSYIPTYGTSQTRAVDVCSVTEASDMIGSTTGSGYVEFTTYNHESFGGIFEIINTSDLGQRLLIWMTSTDDQIQLNIGSGIGGLSIPKNNVSIGKHKAVFTYTTSKIKFFLDGEKVGETTPSSLTGGFNKVDFYHPQGTVYIQKKEISQAVLFKTELSDLDARILTGAATYETFNEMALALNYTVYE